MGQEHEERVIPVQALRLLAALAVVVVHAELVSYHLGLLLDMPVARYPIGLPGGAGVDLFFVISGFVMVLSSRRLYGRAGGAALFLVRRVVRIVPLYWLVTLFVALWTWRMTGPVPGADLLKSLFFVPHASALAGGRMVPVLEPGWTLNFEMLFYALFALLLGASARATVLRVGLALAALVALGMALPLPQPLAFWAAPIVLEFAGGMVLALAFGRGLALPGWLRLALALAAIAGWAQAAGGEGMGWQRLAGQGLPALALMAAATLGPLRLPRPRLWDAGGDLSYALYLVHLPLMVVASWAVRRFGIDYGPQDQWLFIAATIAASLGAAAIVHYALERPLTRWLNLRLTGTRRDRRLETSGV